MVYGTGRTGSAPARPWRQRPRNGLVLLLVLTAAPAAAEAFLLRVGGLGSSAVLAPQASAIVPLSVFHDLRWIFVYHDSWTTFAVEIVGGVVGRAALTTGIVIAAWPDGWPRPPAVALLRINLVSITLVAAVLAPWTAVTVMAAVTSLPWFLFFAMPPVLLLTLFLRHGGAVGGWWRGLPSLPALGWMLGGVLLVTADAVIIGVTPGWWKVAMSAALGALNGAVWRGLVVTAVTARPRLPRVPVAPIAMVLTLAGVVAMSEFAALGLAAAAAEPPPPLSAHRLRPPEQALIFVAGYDSTYEGGPYRGLPVTSYSYRGTDGRGRPLPYDPAETHQSLAVSAHRLAVQVADVHRDTGRRVALLAESEGTLVVRAYLETLPHPDVESVVLLSPLPQPSQVYYPPPGRGGWGVATGWDLRVIGAVVRASSGVQLSADEPFIRSLLDDGHLFRDRVLRPVPGVRMIAFVSVDNAIVDPPGDPSGVAVAQVVGLHGSLYKRSDVQRNIVAFLDHDDPAAVSIWYYPILQRASAAWQAPALRPELNPFWRSGRP